MPHSKMSCDSICSENGLEFNENEGVHFTFSFHLRLKKPPLEWRQKNVNLTLNLIHHEKNNKTNKFYRILKNP